MTEKYMVSAANYTLANQTYYSCGLPRKDAMHIFRDPSTGDIQWTGALTGLSVLGMYDWCQDQVSLCTVKPVLKGHLWDKQNVVFKIGDRLNRF
jgi:hypothetical protein